MPTTVSIFAYFTGARGGLLDKAAHAIFKNHGGEFVGAGTMLVGKSAGERDVQYDVPEANAAATRTALKKAGFRLESTKGAV